MSTNINTIRDCLERAIEKKEKYKKLMDISPNTREYRINATVYMYYDGQVTAFRRMIDLFKSLVQ